MLLTASLIFRAISLINMQAAICVLVALLPTYLIRFKLFSLPTTFLEVMFLMVTGGWLVKKIFNKELRAFLRAIPHLLSKYFLIALGLFLLATTINVFISPNTFAALGIWKAYFIEPVILFFICLDVFKTKADAKKIIGALAISAFFVGAMAVIQKFSGWLVPHTFWGKDGVYRVTSFYGYPNAIGLFLAPIFPLLFFKLITSSAKFATVHGREKLKSFGKIFALIASMIFSLLAIAWSHSAGAMVALIAGALIVALLNKKTRWLAILLIIAGGLVVYANVLPSNVTQELLMKDWSGQVRWKMWQETWTMLKDHPIFGAGLAGYQTIAAPYHIWPFVEIFLYPHNFILTFWSEIGLLGLFSWLALIIIFFKTLSRGIKHPRDAAIYTAIRWSLAIILVHGLVDVPYFKNDLSMLFWLLFCVALVQQGKQNAD
jgi:O-antigen ligase